MSIQTKTPLEVTEVLSASDYDYLDLTLNSGKKARIKKSILLPVCTVSADGLSQKEHARLNFMIGNKETSLHKLVSLSGISKIDALVNVGGVSGLDCLIYLSAVTHSSASPLIQMFLVKGSLPGGVSFYVKLDATNKTLDLYINFLNASYIEYNIMPLFNSADNIKNEISSEDISTLTLINL